MRFFFLLFRSFTLFFFFCAQTKAYYILIHSHPSLPFSVFPSFYFIFSSFLLFIHFGDYFATWFDSLGIFDMLGFMQLLANVITLRKTAHYHLWVLSVWIQWNKNVILYYKMLYGEWWMVLWCLRWVIGNRQTVISWHWGIVSCSIIMID